jgi:hypothetical protein
MKYRGFCADAIVLCVSDFHHQKDVIDQSTLTLLVLSACVVLIALYTTVYTVYSYVPPSGPSKSLERGNSIYITFRIR